MFLSLSNTLARSDWHWVNEQCEFQVLWLSSVVSNISEEKEGAATTICFKTFKVMLTSFSDCRGPVHQNFLSNNATINSVYYSNILHTLQYHIGPKQKVAWCLDSAPWQYTTARFPVHNNIPWKQFCRGV